MNKKDTISKYHNKPVKNGNVKPNTIKKISRSLQKIINNKSRSETLKKMKSNNRNMKKNTKNIKKPIHRTLKKRVNINQVGGLRFDSILKQKHFTVFTEGLFFYIQASESNRDPKNKPTPMVSKYKLPLISHDFFEGRALALMRKFISWNRLTLKNSINSVDGNENRPLCYINHSAKPRNVGTDNFAPLEEWIQQHSNVIKGIGAPGSVEWYGSGLDQGQLDAARDELLAASKEEEELNIFNMIYHTGTIFKVEDSSEIIQKHNGNIKQHIMGLMINLFNPGDDKLETYYNHLCETEYKKLQNERIAAFKEFHDDTINKKFNDPKITVQIEDKEFDEFLNRSEKI